MADESPAPTLTADDLTTAVTAALATVNATRASIAAAIRTKYPDATIDLPPIDGAGFVRFLVKSMLQMTGVELDEKVKAASAAVAAAKTAADKQAQAMTDLAASFRATLAA